MEHQKAGGDLGSHCTGRAASASARPFNWSGALLYAVCSVPLDQKDLM